MTSQPAIKPPYPWFGGKTRVAEIVWSVFGDVKNYVEPFAGGMAVMLARPHWPFADADSMRIETVNDINAWLTNFWRAVKADADAVAYHAADPVSELDLHARGDWLFYRPGVDTEFIERLRSDPDYYCAKSAGWWVWGQSSWIGDAWGRSEGRALPHRAAGKGVKRQCPHLSNAGQGINRKLPHLGDAGKSINRKLPHLGDAGQGINRKLPHLGDAGKGINRQLPAGSGAAPTTRHAAIRAYMRQLCERVARVRICCGDWARVLGPTPTVKRGLTGVFLDPPYAVADRASVYGEHESFDIAHDVRAWAIEHGDDKRMRIALCGYDGEHAMPDTWSEVAWKTHGGYSCMRKRGTNANSARERIWFSPHCLRRGQAGPLFAGTKDHWQEETICPKEQT